MKISHFPIFTFVVRCVVVGAILFSGAVGVAFALDWGEATPQQVRDWINGGADVNASDRSGDTPLHEAAKWNKNPAVIEMLLKAGADVNARIENDLLFKNGETPLHSAAFGNENPAVIEVLLKAGADVNASDRSGDTPLHVAAKWNKNPAVIGVLLKFGADVSAEGSEGKTPLQIAKKHRHRQPAEIIAVLDPPPPLLIQAVIDGDIAEVRRLLEEGADPNETDHTGKTALYYAQKNRQKEIFKLLYQHGAK